MKDRILIPSGGALMYKIRSLVSLLLCATMLISTLSVAGSVAGQELGPNEADITGVAVDVGPQESAEIREQANNIINKFPRQDGLNNNLTVAYSENKGTILISTNEPVSTGSIEASGQLYGENIPRRENARIDAVMIADDIEISKQAETEVTMDTLRNNPKSVENQLVEVTAEYRQLTANSDALDGKVVSTYRSGSLTPVDTPLLGEGAIGDNARSFAREVAESDNLRESTGSVGSQTRAIGFGGQPNYWMDAEATLTIAVVDEGPQHIFFISDVTVDGTKTTLEEVQNGEHDSGEIVTMESSLAATRVSIKESLIATSDCTADTFFVPNAGCVPAVADTVVEGGILYDGDSRLLAAGISNRVQTRPVVLNHSKVVVTGEVVEAENLTPGGGDGYALLIYEVEQRNGINSEAVPPVVKDERSSLTSRLEQQLTTTAEKSADVQDGVQSTDKSVDTQGGDQATNRDDSSQTSVANVDSSNAAGSSPVMDLTSLVGVAGILGGVVAGGIGMILIGIAAVGKVINTRFTSISFKTAFSVFILGIILFIVSSVIGVGFI